MSSADFASTRATSQGDVPGADHRDPLGVEAPVPRGVRVPVEPLHELGGAVAAGQVHAGDVQVPVLLAAGRDDHGVVERADIRERDVAPIGDVAEQPHAGPVQHPVQRMDDLLDARVVRRHAVADQAERGGQPVEHVDRAGRPGLHQDVRGVDPGGTRPDHRHPQRPLHADSFPRPDHIRP
jgi:hypothetical protein